MLTEIDRRAFADLKCQIFFVWVYHVVSVVFGSVKCLGTCYIEQCLHLWAQEGFHCIHIWYAYMFALLLPSPFDGPSRPFTL